MSKGSLCPLPGPPDEFTFPVCELFPVGTAARGFGTDPLTYSGELGISVLKSIRLLLTDSENEILNLKVRNNMKRLRQKNACLV